MFQRTGAAIAVIALVRPVLDHRQVELVPRTSARGGGDANYWRGETQGVDAGAFMFALPSFGEVISDCCS